MHEHQDNFQHETEGERLAPNRQANQDYLTPIVASTSDAMIAIDEHFRVRSFNTAASTLLDWNAESALGEDCRKVLKCRNHGQRAFCGTPNCPLIRVLQQGRSLVSEECVLGALGDKSCNTSISVSKVSERIEGNAYVVFTAREIQAKKSPTRTDGGFVSMVLHELRTPLNSLDGLINLFRQGDLGELTEQQLLYLGYAKEAVGQLTSVVEDILLVMRSDAGQFEIRPEGMDFRALAKQVVTSLQTQAREANVGLNRDIPHSSPLLYVDPLRIKQVLSNLVTNAIKFTPQGGTVTLRARQVDDRFVKIFVSDTGVGISPEDQPYVFERFYQSTRHQRSKASGYGLGLSIAKLIVEQHGGEIGFETVLNKGTTFYFTVPLYRATTL
jgi:signal transduction histidine kinase